MPIATDTAPLTASELERGRLYLQRTRDCVEGATNDLSGAQWSFKPSPERWSIAEIVEHMVLTQEAVLGPIWGQLAQAPPAPEDHDRKEVDAIVLNQFSVRLNQFQAPEMLRPTGRWAPEAALQQLLAGYGRLAEILESSPGLRQHAVPSPPLKAVTNGKYEFKDGYQWLLTVAAHNERHSKQILEVKADPRFPAGRSS